MRTVPDVTRSLSRYVWQAFPSYDHYIARATEGTFDRPACVVKQVGPTLPEVGGWQMVDLVQPYVIYVYPAPLDNPAESAELAEVVHETLVSAFLVGVGEGSRDRVPFYDYADIGLDEALPDGTDPVGFLRVRGFQAEPRQEEVDERRWSVIANLRLAWRRTGRVSSAAPAPVDSSARVTHAAH
jgi:hypothetical protein